MKKRYLLLPATALGLWLLRPGKDKPELAPTTEKDGVGPVTIRRYWVDVQHARKSPEDVVAGVLNHFPEVMPKLLATTTKVKGEPGVGHKGDRYFILMLLRRGYVETELVEPLRFRNRTLRMHPESGWVEFKAIPTGPGAYRLQVQSCVRASTRADRLAYLAGMSLAQRANWQTVLERALLLSGGTEVNRGTDTGEFETVPGGVKPPQTPGGAAETA
ncbi:hypothetical protein [Deinococcus sp.]|uniref:hypothetical protein n=1 Tax=Deinococcus sp. TaxID=47478 RepID=UPI0025C19DE2|nr:hypothetical protein [Deinococcus sp.]